MRRRGFHSIKSNGLVDWRAAGPVRNERLLRRECRCRRVGRASSGEDLDVLGLRGEDVVKRGMWEYLLVLDA